MPFLDLIAIDFADAFHTLWLHKEERPLYVFESDGFSALTSATPRLGQRTTLWEGGGRVAAAALHIVQPMAQLAGYDSHCYVDDPDRALASRPARHRKRALARALLLFLCLGLDVSWMKAQRGKVPRAAREPRCRSLPKTAGPA